MELDLLQKFGIKGKRKTVLYLKRKNGSIPKKEWNIPKDLA